LVEYPSGLRVLFDPVFEDCCAPINMKSLKRFTPPPCEIEDIPFVDVVVISHNHYDHLSYPTVLRIAKKFPEAHFFAPLGNKVWFEKCGITKVTELDWWESRDVREMRPTKQFQSFQAPILEKTKASQQPSALCPVNTSAHALLLINAKHSGRVGASNLEAQRSTSLGTSKSSSPTHSQVLLILTVIQRHGLSYRPAPSPVYRRLLRRVRASPSLPRLCTNRPAPRPLRSRPHPHWRIRAALDVESRACRCKRRGEHLRRYEM
jgi:hypothetical protein